MQQETMEKRPSCSSSSTDGGGEAELLQFFVDGITNGDEQQQQQQQQTAVVEANVDGLLVDDDDDNINNNNNNNNNNDETGDDGGSTSYVVDESADLWVDISDALDNWLDRIVDIEARHNNIRTSSIDVRIKQSIQRMLEDGLLNICEAGELRFVGDSWLRLLNSYSCYSIGCTTYKHDILSALLDLFSAKQITRELFISICVRL